MRSMFPFLTGTRALLGGIFVATTLLAMTPRVARADILVSIPNIDPDDDELAAAGTWEWSYTVQVVSNQKIVGGTAPCPVAPITSSCADFFTVYDFLGFIPGSNDQPANWSFSSQNLGITPDTQAPNDSAAIPNLTWWYTGTTPITDSTVTYVFTADSMTSTPVTVNYSTQGTLSDGSKKFTTSVTDAPGNPVPEPGSMLLLGTGLFGAAAIIRRRPKSNLA